MSFDQNPIVPSDAIPELHICDESVSIKAIKM